ncbi:MAG: outer membrane protein transport protein [Gammaproteobacteria bacterium]|nr:outer membrane protein transport protein [Gammaproteobacteria bacterium]
MNTFNKSLVACAVAASLMVPMTASATNGYFSHGYGIKHKGMAGAGVAAPQSTMSTATNPAAMQSQGNRVDFGVEYFAPNRTGVTRSDNVSYSGDGDSAFFIPEFGYSNTISDSQSWGIVVYGNGGMNTKYPSIAQYSGSPTGANTGIDMAQLFIAPTFSMKIDDKHTFGVSLNLIYQTFEATGLEGFAGFTSDPSTTTNLTGMGKDSSTGWSVKVGWLGELTDQFSVGFAYQTKSEMSEFDSYKELFAENGDFDIPSNWTLGVKFKATPELNVMFDVQQINYSDIASISNENGSGGGTGVLGASNGRGFGWEDMTVVKLGVDYQVNNDLVVRAGYSSGDQPIGADDTAFNLIAPAVIEDHLTLGATWTLANKGELSAYYMHAFENEVIGTTNVPGTSGAANIKMDQDALGIAYGWKF